MAGPWGEMEVVVEVIGVVGIAVVGFVVVEVVVVVVGVTIVVVVGVGVESEVMLTRTGEPEGHWLAQGQEWRCW